MRSTYRGMPPSFKIKFLNPRRGAAGIDITSSSWFHAPSHSNTSAAHSGAIRQQYSSRLGATLSV